MKSPKGLRFLLPLGVSALSLLAVTRDPVAEVSEIDAFQRAVSSQTKADALAFIKDFGSSHLVPDLIDLLQPDVALEVCAGLSGSSSRVRSACDKVKAAATIEPAAGSGTPPVSVVVAPASPASAAVTPTPPAPTPTKAVRPSQPPAPVTQTPNAPMAELPAPPPRKTPPSAPTVTVVPTPEPPAAPATAEQVAIVPLVQQNSPATSERKTSSANITDILRKLTARFERWPFQVNYSDRAPDEMFVTYSGDLGRFVACGDAIGVPNASLEPVGAARAKLNSRMIIHLAENAGSTSRSIDALHIVTLSRPTSQSPDLVDVRLDKPARTNDGRYCWSTGEMERLARMK